MRTKADNMIQPSPCRSEGFMRTVLPALLVAAAVTCVVSTQAQPEQSAAAVATALQKKYDAVMDFSADFTQEAESGVLRKKLVERGSVFVKKPGQMRWTYKAPEEKVFVSDGTRMYMHTPADNQVIVSPVPPTTRRRPRSCSSPARAT